MSIPRVYALAGFLRLTPALHEALRSSTSCRCAFTGFLLYGIALIYGATGSIKLELIEAVLSRPATDNALLLARVGLLLIGFGFKIAAVPFHMGGRRCFTRGRADAGDGFHGGGGQSRGVRRLHAHLHGPPGPARAAMDDGAVGDGRADDDGGQPGRGGADQYQARSPTRRSRMPAISWSGLPLVASPRAGGAILYYLLGYAFTNLGAFAVVVALERRGAADDNIADYRGLATRHPWLAAAMTLFMLSEDCSAAAGWVFLRKVSYLLGRVVRSIPAGPDDRSPCDQQRHLGLFHDFVEALIAMYAREGGAAGAATWLGAVAALVIAAGLVVIGLSPTLHHQRQRFRLAPATRRIITSYWAANA